MATARVTASTVKQLLFVTPLNMKAIIDSIVADNKALVDVQMQLEDDFQQDVSANNGVVNALSAFPYQVTLPAGVTYRDTPPNDDTVCLGNVYAVCDSIQAACAIVINYHLE